ncbi:AAA family ATPase [Actinomadura rugatobispora]|uniref:AAA family ATPase n=1 Tax=Actinomadura rugatobispora TaxID=1994 RepID=A0ABW0ZZA1_9ACTN|nr:LuxR family transcriptional regulator [Actinomadura rugatobispora]
MTSKAPKTPPAAPDGLFVGRAAELAWLDGLLEEGGLSSGGAVALVGEAGIGKTALLDRSSSLASRRGLRVLRVRCDPLLRPVPLGALVAGFREAGRAFAAPPGREVPAAADALQDLADGAPAVLVVDDLHQLDDASAAAIGEALRGPHGPALGMLAATRPRPYSPTGITSVLNRLSAAGLLTIAPVEGLSAGAVAEYLTAALGGPPEPLIAAAVAGTAGNPALLRCVTEELLAAGPGGEGPPELPEPSVPRRKALLARFFAPGEPEQRFAQAFAVLDPTSAATAPLTARLAGVADAEAEARFDDLVDQGILEAAGGGRYRFRHRVLREALRAETGPAIRERWHRAAIDLLRTRPEYPDQRHDVARLFLEIARVGDRDAVAALLAEGERAGADDPAGALPWFRRALALTPPGDPEHARTAVRTARALIRAGEPRAATAIGLDALGDLAPGTERTKLAALFASALMKQGLLAEAKRLVAREQALLHERSSPRLTSQAAYVHAATGDTGRADTLAEQAIAHLRRRTGPDRDAAGERIHVLADLVHLRCVEPRGDEIVTLLAELEAAAADGAPAARASAYAALAFGYATLGDTGRCAAALDRARDLPALTGATAHRPDLVVAEARNAVHLGDWDRAVTVIESAVGPLRAAGMNAYVEQLRLHHAAVLSSRGAWPAAREVLRAAQDDGAPAGLLDAELAHIEMLSGDADVARSRLRRRLAAGGLHGTVLLRVLCRLAEAEALHGEPGGVVAALDEIDRLGLSTLDHHTRAVMLLERGHATGDTAPLRSGLELADAHRLAPLQARARLYLGLAGVDPAENLREAAIEFHRLGALPWRRRAAAALRMRGLRVPKPRKKTGGLTATERQVAELVRLGKPNRQIATAMGLSVKTVEAYLTRLYSRTGCGSRVELARMLDAEPTGRTGAA